MITAWWREIDARSFNLVTRIPDVCTGQHAKDFLPSDYTATFFQNGWLEVGSSAGSGSKFAGFGSGRVVECGYRAAAGNTRQPCCGFRVG